MVPVMYGFMKLVKKKTKKNPNVADYRCVLGGFCWEGTDCTEVTYIMLFELRQ